MTKTERMRELMTHMSREGVEHVIVDEYGPHTPRQLSALWSNAQRPAKPVGRPRRRNCTHCHGTGVEPSAPATP